MQHEFDVETGWEQARLFFLEQGDPVSFAEDRANSEGVVQDYEGGDYAEPGERAKHLRNVVLDAIEDSERNRRAIEEGEAYAQEEPEYVEGFEQRGYGGTLGGGVAPSSIGNVTTYNIATYTITMKRMIDYVEHNSYLSRQSDEARKRFIDNIKAVEVLDGVPHMNAPVLVLACWYAFVQRQSVDDWPAIEEFVGAVNEAEDKVEVTTLDIFRYLRFLKQVGGYRI